MQITIRPARKEDADAVPEIMLQAMEDIVFSFIKQENIEEAINFLTVLFKAPNNLYSYTNTFVAVDEEDNVVGSITGYNGDDFYKLRAPVMDLIKSKYNNDLDPEAETEGGEFYLDTVAVSPRSQGYGVGSLLLKHAVNFANEQGFKQTGLIVDLENPMAMQLYQRIGFIQGKKIAFVGGDYYHMYIASN